MTTCLRAVLFLSTLAWLAVAAGANRGGDRPMIRGAQEAEGPYEAAEPEERDGVLWVRLRSGYQARPTVVRILLPRQLDPPEKRRVLFVLPVEAELQTRYGDGMRTMKALDAANRHGLVLIAPSFSGLPWYCDHPTNRRLRQESYLLEVVVPVVEDLYPHEVKHRGLLGFSKSGWGAFSLLLRHPEAFGAAVAWDAPFLMSKPTYGMAAIVGTQTNFERYRIPTLLEQRAEAVRGRQRLAHFGYGNFRQHHQQLHALMDRLRIPHGYADGPKRRHHWDGGWVEDALRLMDGMLR